jgi:serine/threonine protein kinase
MATLGKYDLSTTLGSGGFAKVKLGHHCETKEQAALKIMKREEKVPPAFYDLVMNEVDSLRGLDHKHIIKLIDFYEAETETKIDGEKKDVFCLVLEFARNGELFNFIAQGGALPEKVTRYYFH